MYKMKILVTLVITIGLTFAVDLTKPGFKVECTKQNCIISFGNMDDIVLGDHIPDERSAILAVKFSSCIMTVIPETIFDKFSSLLCLMVTSPGIEKFEDETFSGASNLQFLYLPGNRIKRLLAGSFSGATNLNEINLADNQIEVVHEEAFDGLEHLESLSLSRNQIAFFSQSTFEPLADLMNLDISGNTIEFLDARLFIHNSKLNGINIADNQIVSITDGFLDVLPQLKVLNMMNNPCTNDTMLENIPLIKIIDSRDQNSDDESALKRCYENYIEMADPESTDLNDLLSDAEIAVDHIEGNIIKELTEELREKDVEIQQLRRNGDLLTILIVTSMCVFFFLGMLKGIMHVVNHSYQKRVASKQKPIEVIKVDPKQVVYTIEI